MHKGKTSIPSILFGHIEFIDDLKRASRPLEIENMMDMQELHKLLGLSQQGLQTDHQVKPTESQTQLPLQTVNPSDIVFISIDVEAYEFAQDKITEIGLSVFDTRSLTSSSKLL